MPKKAISREQQAKIIRQLSFDPSTSRKIQSIWHFSQGIYLNCVQWMTRYHATYSPKSSSKEVLNPRSTSDLLLWGFHDSYLLISHFDVCTGDFKLQLRELRVIFRHERRHEVGTQGLGLILVPRFFGGNQRLTSRGRGGREMSLPIFSSDDVI